MSHDSHVSRTPVPSGTWLAAARSWSCSLVRVQCVVDTAPGCLFGAVDAFGVGAEEDGDAVAGSFGDLGRGYAFVEPGGDGGVAEVVGAFGEQ